MLTYDDLTGFDCLCDLVGTAHLRVADSSYDEDDEARATPTFILSTAFVLLTGAEEKKMDGNGNRETKFIRRKVCKKWKG